MKCSYCFARDELQAQGKDHASRFISLDDFVERLDFLDRSDIREARLIGGEPTLHPLFPELIRLARERGKRIVVFSHGLISTSAGMLGRVAAGGVLGHREYERDPSCGRPDRGRGCGPARGSQAPAIPGAPGVHVRARRRSHGPPVASHPRNRLPQACATGPEPASSFGTQYSSQSEAIPSLRPAHRRIRRGGSGHRSKTRLRLRLCALHVLGFGDSHTARGRGGPGLALQRCP